MDPVECLFGAGDGLGEPWHAYHNCICKEVSQITLDFLQSTVGVHGSWHDTNGWCIDLTLWSALLQYVNWCVSEKLDFSYHVSQVLEGDVYYSRLAYIKLIEFGG
jgi:hypothetical protein